MDLPKRKLGVLIGRRLTAAPSQSSDTVTDQLATLAGKDGVQHTPTHDVGAAAVARHEKMKRVL